MRRVLVKPIVKWAGGKSWLVPELRPLIPAKMRTYVEPFAGGAAVFFALAGETPRPFARAILVDQNAELVACYRAVKNDVKALIARLSAYRYDREQFYEVRALDLTKESDVERGARLIYLNKTCFNGLWRVNSKGQFNVPFGRFHNPKIKDDDALYAASRALADCEIRHGDFASALSGLGPKDFVYFDPPYVPLSKTANFTSYASGGFGEKDQARLVEAIDELRAKGVRAILSNADTEETRALYAKFRQRTVLSRRSINSDAKRRGPTGELVVWNELDAKANVNASTATRATSAPTKTSTKSRTKASKPSKKFSTFTSTKPPASKKTSRKTAKTSRSTKVSPSAKPTLEKAARA